MAGNGKPGGASLDADSRGPAEPDAGSVDSKSMTIGEPGGSPGGVLGSGTPLSLGAFRRGASSGGVTTVGEIALVGTRVDAVSGGEGGAASAGCINACCS